ncbi:MAG: hypothetical protein Q7T70_19995 [Polaromonas sp.]|nr:hypothetical protein [Polaromonas sp.]
MPQSSKDSHGGKSHPDKSSGSAETKKPVDAEKNKTSPTGPMNRGEKKTTP